VANLSLKRVFEIYIFAFVFFLASKPLNDPDFWFHLKSGEYILSHHAFPTTDPFSFTFYGQHWIVHGWLSTVIFYLVQARLGYNALIFLFALLVALTFWFVFRRCHAHPFVTGFAILLGVASISTNIGVRPRVFTLLLTSVFLLVLENYARRSGRMIWTLIPLTALWANLHGGFFFGPAFIVLAMLGLALDRWVGDGQEDFWTRLRVMGIVALGSVLAVVVNPYGVEMLFVPIRVLQTTVYKEVVVDWLSPDFHQPEVFPFLVLFLLTTAALALSPVRPKPSELLLFIVTLYLSFNSQRNIAIFALVAVPLLANYAQHSLNATELRRFFQDSLLARRSAFGLVLLLPLILFAFKLKSTVYGEFRQQTMDVPIKAVEYLKQNQITGNTFTDPNIWSNYLLWALPSNPIFIDGRDVYTEQFTREYLDIISGRSDWHEAFDRYGVRVVIVGPRSLLARKLHDAIDWQEVYEDEMTTVFTKRN
jgi:hypothetical protein